ncbi:uncharacterized protein [Physcomitrium patens]|uniref:Uncharacterized protein n=1 Tax=Physcomitrium patens TaxID=3218 RepID=A0A2K1JTJ4_PHYPA|nr:uncharacterized protein LOC112288203 [Physcomitrium patens]PNR44842.1 hypothetical protein PHYPA_014612 [Physcomitrium patens]|eukprot:XP_024387935.1 uncharacterized protein LOC112288203 [Physcomitrella patens]
MRRGNLIERNRDHREFGMQQPIASLETGILEQSPVSRNFGMTTRKLRFTSSFSRGSPAEVTVEGICSRVYGDHSTLQRALSEDLKLVLSERESNRRAPLRNSNGMQESIANMAGARDYVLRTLQSSLYSTLPAKEGPKVTLEIYEDPPEGVVSAHSLMNESELDFSSPVLRKIAPGVDMKEPCEGLGKDDRGKENRDPNGNWDGRKSSSPLPEWYTRKPLQDITNVLAAVQGDEQHPKLKEKVKKKAISAVAPSFSTLAEPPTKRKDSLITQSKCSTFATPKQFSNLGKNFR